MEIILNYTEKQKVNINTMYRGNMGDFVEALDAYTRKYYGFRVVIAQTHITGGGRGVTSVTSLMTCTKDSIFWDHEPLQDREDFEEWVIDIVKKKLKIDKL